MLLFFFFLFPPVRRRVTAKTSQGCFFSCGELTFPTGEGRGLSFDQHKRALVPFLYGACGRDKAFVFPFLKDLKVVIEFHVGGFFPAEFYISHSLLAPVPFFPCPSHEAVPLLFLPRRAPWGPVGRSSPPLPFFPPPPVP